MKVYILIHEAKQEKYRDGEFLKATRDANVNAAKNATRRYDFTDLYFAIIECNPNKIRRLLERGADPNVKNKTSTTPLHSAAEDCPEAVPILIE